MVSKCSENDPSPTDPSEAQIAARAAKIRLRWSDGVKQRRQVRTAARWTVPQVSTREIIGELSAGEP